MWDPTDILNAIASGVEQELAAIDLEQAVYGLDAHDEVTLHPLLASALESTARYDVHREVRYPSDRVRHRRRSVGERCDLVLTPVGSELAAPEAEATLFDNPDACPLVDAYWLEVKVAHQFLEGRPRPGYGSKLRQPAASDAFKLWKDPGIARAGVLLIAFCADARVAAHDLDEVERTLRESSAPIEATAGAMLPMTERQGHGICAMRLLSVL